MKGKHHQSRDFGKRSEEREQERKELSQQEKSKKKKRYTYSISLAIIVIGAIFYFGVIARPDPSVLDPFISCLGDADAKFYGSFQCPACASQKRLFHDSKELEKEVYIECGPLGGPTSAECRSVGITSYPTWIFEDGERITGVTPLSTLAEKTGCVLDESLS